MKIYTKSGDKGETSLFRGGRVGKDSLRVSAYGTVDELNSWIGCVRYQGPSKFVDNLLDRIQHNLFLIGSDLATPQSAGKDSKSVMRLPEESEIFMEEGIDKMEGELTPLRNFILPGGSKMSAALHFARTITRRAERSIIALIHSEEGEESAEQAVSPPILKYINRLSDLLFVMARYENKVSGTSDIEWKKDYIT